MTNGKEILERFNDQPRGVTEGYKTLQQCIDEALKEAGKDQFLLNLLEFKNKIKHNGEISLIPYDTNDLSIRVTWYFKQIYIYQETFRMSEVEVARCDTADRFVEGANRAIGKILEEGNKKLGNINEEFANIDTCTIIKNNE